jgi:hypothetical protein
MNRYRTWKDPQPVRPATTKSAGFRRFAARLVIVVVASTMISRAEPRLDVLEFSSRALKHNPMGDPVTRRVAVFVQEPATSGVPLPIVYYLPGFGGSSESAIKDPARWRKTTEELAGAGTPVAMVVVDGKTRWGGSQHLNSAAQGNHADCICDEVAPRVERRCRIAPGTTNRIIAGHSSGGLERGIAWVLGRL